MHRLNPKEHPQIGDNVLERDGAMCKLGTRHFSGRLRSIRFSLQHDESTMEHHEDKGQLWIIQILDFRKQLRNEVKMAYLLHERSKFSETFQNRLVCNRSNIFDVVKGLALLLSWNSSSWFSGIDALQNTQTTKILDRNLKHLKSLGPPNEGRL